MGKPRMIILIRHAQSEGNKNRDIHQMIPDHRVKLTPDGWQQAEEAGRRLRDLLKPDDTLQFFTSPYRRTRETTEGILRTLTSDQPSPSPFPRHTIKVWEEPRLREQDFGNFQPCSGEMERMWQERADYGHFFYRIPNGESAADAYDRVSGFNESLWRSFGEQDFPSVCVLVTHGLMTRVFLMKWYHWSVEYFEDLRNINHCEFITMTRNPSSNKFILKNTLRTWSELKRKAALDAPQAQPPAPPDAAPAAPLPPTTQSPSIPTRKWGGCIGGCNHDHTSYPRRSTRPPRRQNTQDLRLPAPAMSAEAEKEDHPVAAHVPDGVPSLTNADTQEPTPAPLPPHGGDGSLDATAVTPKARSSELLNLGRDFGGSRSGAATPAEGFSDSEGGGSGSGRGGMASYFTAKDLTSTAATMSASTKPSEKRKRKRPSRRTTQHDLETWAKDSGMGTGARADALGDADADADADAEGAEDGEDSDADSEVYEDVHAGDGKKEHSRDRKIGNKL
ncbi:hypothetical protein B0A49_09130 [Cryomyces minteri]|uniref:Uncharacterized protein n=3 Tax=Cryomyces minteri TaxID=331657 RepID=A0A4U0WLC4_9PEZI|nr:hypothetical protein B0A49_09130 [Cryomyces minteri]